MHIDKHIHAISCYFLSCHFFNVSSTIVLLYKRNNIDSEGWQSIMTFFFTPSASKRRTVRKLNSASAACSHRHTWILHLVRCHIPFAFFAFLSSPLTPPETCRTAPIGVPPVAPDSRPKLFCVSQVFLLLLQICLLHILNQPSAVQQGWFAPSN